MQKNSEIRLPKRFYTDHLERDLPTPVVVRETASYFVVLTCDPAIEDLFFDAEFYADKYGPDCDVGLKSSARATIAKIKEALRLDSVTWVDDFGYCNVGYIVSAKGESCGEEQS